MPNFANIFSNSYVEYYVDDVLTENSMEVNTTTKVCGQTVKIHCKTNKGNIIVKHKSS